MCYIVTNQAVSTYYICTDVAIYSKLITFLLHMPLIEFDYIR